VQKITSKIIKILSKKKPLNLNKILTADSDYFESGYVDSLNFIKFIFEIEDKFNIEFTKKEINSAKFKKINGLSKIISNKLSQK
tara:strand:+ start:257 stop:508 length:252 start_codon:yes stop_codon:yes gene_type:complete